MADARKAVRRLTCVIGAGLALIAGLATLGYGAQSQITAVEREMSARQAILSDMRNAAAMVGYHALELSRARNAQETAEVQRNLATANAAFAAAKAALDAASRNDLGLFFRGPRLEELAAQHPALVAALEAYLGAAEIVAAREPSPHASWVEANAILVDVGISPLLSGLDDLAVWYRVQSQDAVDMLIALKAISWIAILIVVSIGAVFALPPLVRQVRHAIDLQEAEAKRRAELVERLRGHRNLTGATIAAIPDGIQVKDAEGRHLLWNRSLFDILHLHADAILGTERPAQLMRDALALRQEDHLMTVATGERAEQQTHDGRWIETRVSATASGGTVTVLRDVTERRERERLTRERNQMLEMAERLAEMGHWHLDLRRGRLYASKTVYDIFGWDRDWEALDIERMHAAFHPDDRAGVEASFAAAIENGTAFETEGRIVRPDGTVRHLNLTCICEMDAKRHRAIAVFGVLLDITDRKRIEEDLRRLATTDTLTGVANRRRFMERAAEEHQRMMRYGQPLSVALLDIDRFKSINDTHGHAVGDDALIAFAETVQATIRPTDMLGRIGGEEFAILLPETDLNGAQESMERVRRAVMDIRVAGEGGVFGFTTSAGIAAVLAAETSVERALERADEALYDAKQTGRNKVCVKRGGPRHDPLIKVGE